MSTNDQPEQTVVLRRHWSDYRQAVYRLADVERPHWTAVSGGVGSRSPRPFVHVYVQCDGEVSGELAHSAAHGPCPHRIKACMVQKDNPPAVVAELRRQADAADMLDATRADRGAVGDSRA